MQSKQNSNYYAQSIKSLLFIIFSMIIFNLSVFSQSVDTSFDPVLANPAAFSGSTTVQPDGKILVYGSFQIIQGVQRKNIARLNPDGSLDNSFNCTACDFTVVSVVVQSDGNLMVGGAVFDTVGSASRIRRLNPDGSIDTSFTSPFSETPSIFSPVSHIRAIQSDGKIYVSQNSQPFGQPIQRLYRLNPTGSIDNTFNVLTFDYGPVQFGPASILVGVRLLPDGKLMISGKHNFGFLFRVNTDGTKDTTFESPILANTNQRPAYATSFSFQTDDKILFMGNFNSVNGVSKSGIARLNADQSLDSSYTFPVPFATTNISTSSGIIIQSDGKMLVSGPFANTRIVRLNADGSLDNSFNAPTDLVELGGFSLDMSGRILVRAKFGNENAYKLAWLNPDGSLDTILNISFGVPGNVISSTVQADGKIVIFGSFSLVNNIPRRRMARLNPDGSLDPTFESGTGFNRDAYQLVSQPDGKILATGIFEFYNGVPRDSFARINADGSLDNAFNPILTNAVVAVVLTDGKILVGGDYSTVNGTTRTGLARLNADGSLDNSFNPVLGGTAVVLSMLVQPDGKIMIGGIFSSVNGTNRDNLARLNSDGTLDTSFDGGTNPQIRILERQQDGKYLISERNKIYRKNADGSTDSSFTSIDFDNQSSIRSIIPQTDGTILAGGSFTRVNNDSTKAYLARLNANGTLSSGSLPGGVNGKVWTLSKQADKKIIVGGEFTSIGGESRFGIARLSSPFVANTLFDYDGDGRSDISVYRASENRWYELLSGNSQVSENVFGLSGDIVAPADFDGDGKTDLGIFRPSTGNWWYQSSIDNVQRSVQFGANGDIPRPSDFDGDGKADFIVFRPSENVWYRLSSGSGQVSVASFGLTGDKPLTGDFDGDGKSDLAIYRPSAGQWWYQSSINNVQHVIKWGIASDVPAPGDYNGDGKTDFAIFRPSEGNWYIFDSTGNYTYTHFGLSEDKPVPADYDGDGKTDIAVFRPSTGVWYILQSADGFKAYQLGVSTDIPTQNAFIP